jgi:hypothetical protein
MPQTPRDTASQRRAMTKLQADKHQKRWALWTRMLPHGGMIICRSWGAAINERQAMYTTRKIAQEAYGVTPFDDLVIRLKGGDHRLEVGFSKTNVLDAIPFTEGEDLSNEYVVPRAPEQEVLEHAHQESQESEVPTERGRAPLTFEPEEPTNP